MTRGIVVDPVPSTPVTPQSAPAPVVTAQPTDDGLPEKFKGKSAKEIADAYAQLESEKGRLANDLGDTRAEARTWRSLYEEVGAARRAEPQAKPAPVEISSDQLIASPKESVSAIVNELLETRLGPVVKDTQRLAQSVEAQEFVRDFPNYVQTGNDPEFQEFVGKSARRRDLAAKALQSNDVKAMRSLMEDWEERQALVASFKPNKQETTETEQVSTAPTGVEGARKVATEKSGNNAALPSGKVMYQTDVINTMLKDPNRYYSEAYQAELVQAITEKRLK